MARSEGWGRKILRVLKVATIAVTVFVVLVVGMATIAGMVRIAAGKERMVALLQDHDQNRAAHLAPSDRALEILGLDLVGESSWIECELRPVYRGWFTYGHAQRCVLFQARYLDPAGVSHTELTQRMDASPHDEPCRRFYPRHPQLGDSRLTLYDASRGCEDPASSTDPMARQSSGDTSLDEDRIVVTYRVPFGVDFGCRPFRVIIVCGEPIDELIRIP